MGQRLLQRPSYGCLYKGGASSARRHSRSPSAAHQASPPSPAVTGRREPEHSGLFARDLVPAAEKVIITKAEASRDAKASLARQAIGRSSQCSLRFLVLTRTPCVLPWLTWLARSSHRTTAVSSRSALAWAAAACAAVAALAAASAAASAAARSWAAAAAAVASSSLRLRRCASASAASACCLAASTNQGSLIQQLFGVPGPSAEHRG